MNRSLIAACGLAGLGLLAAGQAASAQTRESRLAIFDTTTTSAKPIDGESLAKQEGWAKVAPPEKAYSFKGDAVLAGEGLMLVFRRQAAAVELYGRGADGVKLRSSLSPVGGAATLSAVKIAANDRGSAAIEATFKAAGGADAVVTFAMAPGSPIVQTQPSGHGTPAVPGVKSGATGLRVEAPCRLGVLPDFFADDTVIDARAIPVDRTEIPAENFFMQMLGEGESILTAIWDRSSRDVEITLAGEKEARLITAVDVYYGEAGASAASQPGAGAAGAAGPASIWLALLERKGLWAQAELLTPEDVKKVTPLGWGPPFRAKWKGDFMRVDHTVDSWGFEYGAGSRSHWSSVAGTYNAPCWFDGKDDASMKGFIQPATGFPNANFAGPFVAYPIDRVAATPADQLTITDLMRNSLGEGPCEYIMDVAGAKVRNRGIFTCAFDAIVQPLFDGGRQKEERVFLDRGLKEVQVFVTAIRDRINAYVEFRGETLKYLAEQKTAHPDLAEFIGRLEAQTKKIQATKVDSSAPVAKLVAQIKAEAISDMPRRDMAPLTAEGAGGIAAYGGSQDGIVARCRNATKMLRQMATIEMAVNPKSAPVSKEVRKRTEQILRGALSHE